MFAAMFVIGALSAIFHVLFDSAKENVQGCQSYVADVDY